MMEGRINKSLELAQLSVEKQLAMTEPTLPAPTPRNLCVELPFAPRMHFPVSVRARNTKKDSPYYKKLWQIDLIAVPMETVRNIFPIRYKGTEEARQNLQQWVDNIGPALYNPIWWKVVDNHQLALSHRNNPWFRKVHGSHRLRTQEALDFDFIYVYLQTGACDHLTPDANKLRARNARKPTKSRLGGHCDECGAFFRYSRGARKVNGIRCRVYKCQKCGHKGTGELIYPEPV